MRTDNNAALFCTDLKITRSRVLLEKLTVSQLVKNFSAFHVTRRFITVFIADGKLSLFFFFFFGGTTVQSGPSVALQ